MNIIKAGSIAGFDFCHQQTLIIFTAHREWYDCYIISNMKISKVVSVGATATTFMTLYSYILSEIKDEHFREPEILGQLLRRLIPLIKKKYTRAAGWQAHYLVGILFAAVYIYLWSKKGITPTVKNGLLFGGISGLIAMGVWKSVMKMHPNPPLLHFKKFYMQLLPAHIVFGLAATLSYNNSLKQN